MKIKDQEREVLKERLSRDRAERDVSFLHELDGIRLASLRIASFLSAFGLITIVLLALILWRVW